MFCIILGGNLVTWRNKKQVVIASLTTEPMFRTMAQRICELLWPKIIPSDLGMKWKPNMNIHWNNKSEITLANNLVQYDHKKHDEVDWHFINKKLDRGLICTSYVLIDGQLVDILKSVYRIAHSRK